MSRVSNWWKRRNNFYLVHENAIDYPADLEDTFEEEADGDSQEGPNYQVGASPKSLTVPSTPESSPETGDRTPKTPEQSRKVPMETLGNTRRALFVGRPPCRPPYPLVRSRTADSFQGSLESMDSLVESYWDPQEDDDGSEASADNLMESSDFLEEHIDFLRLKTRAKKVKVVWATPTDASNSAREYSA